MCTVILIEEKGKPKIAKRDIAVYKRCIRSEEGDILSYFERFKYIPNRLYKVRLSFTESRNAFDDIEQEYAESLSRDAIVYVGHGFHAVLKPSRLRASILDDVDGIVRKFIVPKGAKYYTNAVGNIVSNKIILREQ